MKRHWGNYSELLFYLDGGEAFLAFFPAFACKLLHVTDLVVFIGYLEAEHSLDDILQCEDTLEASVLVDDDRDLLFVLDERIPDVGQRGLLVEIRQGAFDVLEAHVELVLGEEFERVGAEDIAGDELARVGVNRYAGEMVVVVVFVEVAQRHVLRGNGSHNAGRHDVVGLDVLQFDDVLDNLVLALLKLAFFLAHVSHGRQLLARIGDLFFGAVGRDAVGEFFYTPDDRIQEENHGTECACCKMRQVAPIGGADGLGDDLGEDEYQDSGDDGDETEPCTAEDHRSLTTHARRTDGVGDGIQREDSRQRTVGILFIRVQQCSPLVALSFPHLQVRNGGGQKRGLEYRTEERYRHC